VVKGLGSTRKEGQEEPLTKSCIFCLCGCAICLIVSSTAAVVLDIATDAATQPSENWTMFMEICDLINSSEEGFVAFNIH